MQCYLRKKTLPQKRGLSEQTYGVKTGLNGEIAKKTTDYHLLTHP